MTALPLPHAVDLLNATGTVMDDFGNIQPDWLTATVTPGRAFLQPSSGREDTQGRDVQVGDHVLFLEPTARITGRSRVRHGSKVYEVVGPPRAWSGSHIEADLRRIEG